MQWDGVGMTGDGIVGVGTIGETVGVGMLAGTIGEIVGVGMLAGIGVILTLAFGILFTIMPGTLPIAGVVTDIMSHTLHVI